MALWLALSLASRASVPLLPVGRTRSICLGAFGVGPPTFLEIGGGDGRAGVGGTEADGSDGDGWLVLPPSIPRSLSSPPASEDNGGSGIYFSLKTVLLLFVFCLGSRGQFQHKRSFRTVAYRLFPKDLCCTPWRARNWFYRGPRAHRFTNINRKNLLTRLTRLLICFYNSDK